MMFLEDLIAELELQGQNVVEAYEAEINGIDTDMDNSNSSGRSDECTVFHEHVCLYKMYSAFEGRLIALWARLELPEDRARTDSWNVRRFRETKSFSDAGMGNGLSPLRSEVKPEDVEGDA
jgi:hypothetical protein